MQQKKISEPTNVDIKFILDLINSGKIIDAKKEIDKKITKFPSSSILSNILGATLAAQNEPLKAIESYNRAIKINPSYAQAYNNLAITLYKMNKVDEAIKTYKKSIDLNKSFAEPYYNLGNIMLNLEKFDESISLFETAIKNKPNYSDALYSLGDANLLLGNIKESIKNFEKAIKIQPNLAEAYNRLGLAFNNLKKFDESLFNYKKAIEIKPDYEKAYNNLGGLLSTLGKFDEAIANFKQAIKLKPDYAIAHSNLLFNLNYKLDFDSNVYLKEAKNFSTNCKPKKETPLNYEFDKKPSKLKIGLVSSDFGNHPGGYFTLNTLKELKEKKLDLTIYSNFDRKDEYYNYFKSLSLKWHSIKKIKDEDVVNLIVRDKIHILIDLQGHSGKNRLPIFIHKPAPIQASWLAQGSTGISEIDYFIGSPHITPDSEKEYYIEKIINLPEISQCFTPPEFDIKISSLPALKNKFLTFGSLNNIKKINDETISLWSKVLLSNINSKLILKSKDFNNLKVKENIISKFVFHNIDIKRLDLRGESKSRRDLLEVYNEIDITLDTFPFQGNTTTCESVWMGVPVLTLKGNRYLFHFGESINSNLNMKVWIADNHAEFVKKSIIFSSDLKKLSEIRSNLRQKSLQSPVFDAPRFSLHFDQMLWRMWDKFISKN